MKMTVNLFVVTLIVLGFRVDAKDTIKNVAVEGGVATVTATLATDRVLTLWVTDDLTEGWTRLYNGHPAVTGYLTGNPVDAQEFIFEMNAGENKRGYCKVDLFDPDPNDLLRTLSLGDIGDDVATLQVILQDRGYLQVPLDFKYGTYDIQTQLAVSRYQVAMGISPVSGTLDSLTRQTLVADSSQFAIVKLVDTYTEAVYDDVLHGGIFGIAVDVTNISGEDIFINLDAWEHDFYLEEPSGWQGYPTGDYIAFVEVVGDSEIVNDYVKVVQGATETLQLIVYLEPEESNHFKLGLENLLIKNDPYSETGVWIFTGVLKTDFLYIPVP